MPAPYRRTLLPAALLVAACALHADERTLAILTGPYLENPAADRMTITWITSRNSTGSVEFKAEGGEIQTAIGSHHGLVDANSRIHRVELKGLKSGTRYRYRVLSKDIREFAPYKVTYGETVSSAYAEFRTPSPHAEGLSFLVFNDIHETHGIIQQMLGTSGKQPYELVVLNGDILSHIEQESQITGMLDEAVQHFASRIPMVWVRGNHETRGAFARMLPDYVGVREGRFFYSFDYGPVHFIVLDTGEDKPDTSVEYSGLVDFDAYRGQQAEWLRQEIRSDASRKARFRVVLAHMPFSEGGDGKLNHGISDGYERFGALLNEGKVDLLISAHKHRAAVVEAVKGAHDYPIVRGGGPTEDNRTLIRVDVSGARLRANILRPGGNVVGSVEVTARN